MANGYFEIPEGTRFPMGPLQIDVKKLYATSPSGDADAARPGLVPAFSDGYHRVFYSSRLLPLGLRVQLKSLLRNANLDTCWLQHFRAYWSILGGRPFWHVSDFFFLRNFYRLRQPPPDVNTITDAHEHLSLWQDEGFLYGLFHATLKETFTSEYECLKLLRKLQPNCRSLLEYGAGAAPITHAILEHNSCKSDCEFVIADLPTLVFHYAKHKFRQCSNVEAVVLDAEHSFRFETDRKFDAVFCCQVFEHLTEPLETAKRFAEMLTDDGVLYFDFAMSDARGLDSRQGMEERNQVLDFIASEFSIEHGCIDPARDVGFTAARRKR